MATNVYGGPGNKAYAVIGSLDFFDSYSVLWEEYGWKFIEYPVDVKKKRGYIEGGDADASPSAYGSGVLAKMSSSQTVYGGPSNVDYVSIGSVSTNESVTVFIPNESGYAFIEYSTSNGTKRGYVQGGIFVSTNITALAKMNQDTTTYSEPYLSGQVIGSLFEEEYVIVLAQNETMSYVEYNTVSGRKSAYVFSYKLDRINTLSQIPGLEVSNDFVYAVMNSDTNVYSGPSQINYALIGSVNYREDIGVIHKENEWLYIQYATTGGPKRGFVPATSVINGTIIVVSDKTNSYTGWTDLTTVTTPVYAGPGESYASIGTVAANEAVTVFAGADNSFFQIEYSTAAGPKRGFIHGDELFHYDLGGLAIVEAEKIVVHYTPELATTPQYGAIAMGEYIVILEKNQIRCYIEYNTSSARKRGYTSAEGYIYKNIENVGPLPDLADEAYMASSDLTVYAGPSNQYAMVGSVYQYEPVTRLREDVLGYSYIEYIGSEITKRGYVLISSIEPYKVVIPDFSYPYITKGIYGQSGAGRPLEFYQIGSGNNHLILNFAIHGFEDSWAHDGLELVNLAGSVLQMLSNNITLVENHDWSVFVIPTSNPDGLIDGYTNDGPGRCTTWRYGDTRGVLVEGGVDLNRSFDANFVPNTELRNYTGPYPNWAKESEALRDFITSHKSETGRNVFIDTHGWTKQIITVGGSNSVLSGIFVARFPSYIDRQYELSDAPGYVAIYAHSLGMEACLFEFPGDVAKPGDLV